MAARVGESVTVLPGAPYGPLDVVKGRIENDASPDPVLEGHTLEFLTLEFGRQEAGCDRIPPAPAAAACQQIHDHEHGEGAGADDDDDHLVSLGAWASRSAVASFWAASRIFSSLGTPNESTITYADSVMTSRANDPASGSL